MIGFRTEYRRTGEKERQCLHFLKMCSIGPAYIIQELLCNYKVSQDLMDGRGNNGVMFAAVSFMSIILKTTYEKDKNN